MNYQREYILNELQSLVYKEFSENIIRLEKLNADASERNIFRIFTAGRSLIGVINNDSDENISFIKFSESFKHAGFNVPEVYAVSDDNRIYIEEDLGEMTLHKFSLSGSQKENLFFYSKALNDLQEFQIKGIDCIDLNFCHQSNEFTSEIIQSDFQKFEDFYLSKIKKSQIDAELFSYVKEFLSEINSSTDKNYFLYRDFQTRNIMIKEGELFYIDYQSGRRGALHYDTASFLYSGSISISEGEKSALLNHYIETVSKKTELDIEKFRYEFYYYALMRLIQILGSYGYTFLMKKNDAILKKVPKAIQNIKSLKNKISEPKILKFIESMTS